jgi:hypothetical protein
MARRGNAFRRTASPDGRSRRRLLDARGTQGLDQARIAKSSRRANARWARTWVRHAGRRRGVETGYAGAERSVGGMVENRLEIRAAPEMSGPRP